MKSLERRKELGQRVQGNINRILADQDKTAWWLVQRVETLEPDVASHATLCSWFTGKAPSPHRIPAVALPVITQALKCDISELFREARWLRCECCDNHRYWCKLHDSHYDECPCRSKVIDYLASKT